MVDALSPAAVAEPEPGFDARSPWSAWGAVLAVIVVVLLAMASAAAVGTIYFMLNASHAVGGSRGASPFSDPQTRLHMMAAMVMMQLVMIVMTVWLAGWYGAARVQLLSLGRRLKGRDLALGIAGMVAILLPYNLLIYALWPKDFTRDLQPFAELARSDAAWLAAIVVAIGAPLSEEIIFRGFLLPALARARAASIASIAGIMLLTAVIVLFVHDLAFGRGTEAIAQVGVMLIALVIYLLAWRVDRRGDVAAVSSSADMPAQVTSFVPAALFTSAMWTSMHVGYSMTGLVEIFMIGLFFCWLIWRTGNLWLTISLHGLYNGLQFLVLNQVPLPAPG